MCICVCACVRACVRRPSCIHLHPCTVHTQGRASQSVCVARPCCNNSSAALQVVHTLLRVGCDMGPLGVHPPCAGPAVEEAERSPLRGPHPACPYLPSRHTPSKRYRTAVYTDRVGGADRNVPTSGAGISTAVRVSVCLGPFEAGQDAPHSLSCWVPLLHIRGADDGPSLETKRSACFMYKPELLRIHCMVTSSNPSSALSLYLTADASNELVSGPLGALAWHHVFGACLFLWAGYHQNRCHHILADLRRRPKPEVASCSSGNYSVPHGDWFTYVSSPHYLAEVLLYVGVSSVTFNWQWTNWALPCFSLLILTLSGKMTHNWYLETFDSYKKLGRRVIIPYLY